MMVKLIKLLIVIFIASALIAAGLLETTFKTYDSFTELYFEDFRSLPSVCYPGETYNFSFTVVSHEKKETDYSYHVRILDQTYTGNFSLKDNESRTIPVEFRYDTHHFTKIIDRGQILNHTALFPRRLYLKSNVTVILNETNNTHTGYYLFVNNTLCVVPKELGLVNGTISITGDENTVYEMNRTLTPRPIFQGDSMIPLEREGVFFAEHNGRIEKHTFRPFGLEASLPLRNNYADWDSHYVPMGYALARGISGATPLFAAADALSLEYGKGKYLLTTLDTTAYRGEMEPLLQLFQDALIYFLSNGTEISASSLGGLNSTRVLCYAQSNARDCDILKRISEVTTAYNLHPYDYEHSLVLDGLEPNTTYYFMVKSRDKNNRSGQSSQYSFTTLNETDDQPPAITDLDEAASDTAAVITWETDEPTVGVVRYGRESGIYLNTEESTEYGKEHGVVLRGLMPSTLYYYVVDITDRFGNRVYSDEHIFYTRGSPDSTPPVINNVKSSTVQDGTIKITLETSEPARVSLSYGKTSGRYGSRVISPQYTTSHTITLTGLLPSTTYYYAISAVDPSGNTETLDEAVFTTPARGGSPWISNVDVPQITATSATITWDTLEASDSAVLYGTRSYDYTVEVRDESDISHLPDYDVFWVASDAGVLRSDLEKYAEEIKDFVGAGGRVWLSSPDNESWNSSWLPYEVRVEARDLHGMLPTKEAGILTAFYKRQELPTRYFGTGNLPEAPEGRESNITLNLEEANATLLPKTYLLEGINVSVIDNPHPPFDEYAYEISGDYANFYLEGEDVNIELAKDSFFVDKNESVYRYDPIKVQVNLTTPGGLYDIYFWTTSQKRIPLFYRFYQDVKTPYGSATIYARSDSGLSLEDINGTIQNPLGVRFSNKVELLGYDINKREFRPGEELEVAIYWRCIGKMLDNYTLTFDIRSPDFTPLTSIYTRPVAGSYDTSRWGYYDIIVEEYTIPFPPAINGTYNIWTGIYGEDRPILTSSGYDTVRLTNITVM